jgi:large repetitive protein
METAKHTRLRGNRARRSKDDGIDVEGRTTKLTRNRALRNGDLGIEAVRGVIDGGGNMAGGNGDPRQCTNVACS